MIGTVTDSQNTIVPGASVTSRNVSTGIIRASTTDSAGRYRIAAIPPGEYEFTAQLPGFAATTRTGVTLTHDF